MRHARKNIQTVNKNKTLYSVKEKWNINYILLYKISSYLMYLEHIV